MNPSQLWDCHTHTEYAYCRDNVTGQGVLDAIAARGLAGVCITEHSPQLYCTRDDFWVGKHVRNPDLWRATTHNRMAAFRESAQAWRGETCLVGLEVELDEAGDLTLLDEDRDWPDLLLGAIHWLPHAERDTPQRQWDQLFLDACRKILDAGVEVLAHPLRQYAALGRPISQPILDELATMLAATNTASELNLHKGIAPEPAFYHACLERNVPIALGSDAHDLSRVGLFDENIQFLQQWTGQGDVTRFLYTPVKRNR